ncbi:MAG: zinc-binding dehydrogenase [Alphaproteobacteria bacterium]
MKAIVIHEHGGVDKLRYEDVPSPEPGPGDVVIQVHAAGLNHFDHDVREGLSGIDHPKPHIMGLEAAGTVAAIGTAVTGFKTGDRVAPVFALSAGRCNLPVCNCEKGLDNLCPVGGILGVTHPGCYAEYVKVAAHNVLHLPEGLDFEEAASVQVTMATAWHMMVTQLRLIPGETVLVNAAGSGIGSSAIQIGKLLGATVITTAGQDEKLRQAKELGADFTINYTEKNISAEVMDITRGRGVDAVVESVGGTALQQSLDALAWGGRLATCGAHAGETVPINIIEFFRKEISMTGTHGATKGQIAEVFRLVTAKKLRPIIHSRFALADAAKAHELADSRNFFGKILLCP